VNNFDAALTWSSFEQHRHVAKTPRALQNFETVVKHSKAEVEADLDTIFETLVPEPMYYDYGVVVGAGETGPKGHAEVLKNYETMVHNGAYVIESRKDKVMVDDTRLVSEGSFRQILNAEAAKAQNLVPGDATGFFLVTARTAVFWEFDDEGLAKGETRYVVPLSVEPLAEEDLPAHYPAHLRTHSNAAG
jgi:hypothetical protein